MTKNYNLGIQWLREILKRLIPLHKRDECLQKEFWVKYGKFIEAFQTYLPNTYSEENIKVYRKYFIKIREDIINYVKSKLKKMDYHYFNISLYRDQFQFVEKINTEIEYLISNIENYYTEDYFDMKFPTNISN